MAINQTKKEVVVISRKPEQETVIETSVTTYSIRRRILKSQKDKEGKVPIYIELELLYKPKGFGYVRKFKRFPTGVKIVPARWSTRNGGTVKEELHTVIINGETDSAFYLNKRIYDVQQNVQIQIDRLQETADRIDLPEEFKEIRKYFLSKKVAKITLLDHFDKYITYRKGQNPKQGSWKEFVTVKNRVKRYQDTLEKPLQFDDINLTFADNFKQYLRTVPHKTVTIETGKKKQTQQLFYDANTIKKTMVTFCTFLNHHFKRKQELNINLSEKFLLEDFKEVKGGTEAPPITLDEKEIEKIWTANDKIRNHVTLSRIRELMLLQIGTGCRVSDLFRLGNFEKNHIKDDIQIYYPVKTAGQKKDNEARVPLNRYSRHVLELCEYDSSSLKMADQHYNRGIKELLKELGIDTPLNEHEVTGRIGKNVYKKWEVFSSHNCRDTFISRMLNIGTPVPMVMRMVGQNKYEVMRRYFKDDSTVSVSFMSKF